MISVACHEGTDTTQEKTQTSDSRGNKPEIK